MNILIKGMDMPKGCDETCPLYLAGQCCEGCDCPLIEIPTPHGRIIDESDLKNELPNIQDLNFEALAPTILESEE